MNFEGKTVLITGAAGTIGRATALGFYRAGANLALVDKNPAALEAFQAEAQLAEERTLLLEADVTEEAQVEGYVSGAVERFGAIHVFHNNVGITGQRAKLTDMDAQRFKRLMDINVNGVFLGLKHVLRQMYRQGFGSIINTSSHKGRLCAAESGDYAASKSAVIMLTKAAALEAAEYGVRVNCLMPGIVKSELILSNRKKQNPGMTDAEIEQHFAAALPLGRWCLPEEVADMVMFLASNKASYLTGMELRLDGGTTAAFL